MKKLAYLLSILILFQSCYSYKAFDLNNYETIKPKKVEIELKGSKKFKGTITEIKKDQIILKTSKELIEINTSKVKKIKKRKFSLVKTILVTTIGIYLISIMIENLFNSAIKGLFKGIRFPA